MRSPVSVPNLKKKLIQENLVTAERFEELVAEAERKNQNLVDVLVSQRVIDSYYVNNFIAAALGVELADLSVRPIDKETVQSLPEEIARQRQVIIFNREPGGAFDAAMADPSDLETITFLTQYLKAKIKPFLATAEDLNRGFSIYGFQSARDAKKDIEEQIQASLRAEKKTVEEAAADLPIVAIVDNLLSYAISSRASDIHLEILEDETMIRYRVDGILYEIMRIPKSIHAALVARIKLLGGLKL
ncbi:MAG: ATPase, T2SS/T4P/T4SS family, partial [Patescibacteria group bacterium]